MFFGVPCHLQKALYKPSELFDYVENCINELLTAFPNATMSIVLAGDFNTLDDAELTLRNALHSIVARLTRGQSELDRVYVNDLSYATIQTYRQL